MTPQPVYVVCVVFSPSGLEKCSPFLIILRVCFHFQHLNSPIVFNISGFETNHSLRVDLFRTRADFTLKMNASVVQPSYRVALEMPGSETSIGRMLITCSLNHVISWIALLRASVSSFERKCKTHSPPSRARPRLHLHVSPAHVAYCLSKQI